MKLSKLPIEEIELMSYTDLAYLLLKESKKAMNTPTIFREIANLLEYSEDQYTSKIGDFYTSLTIDKRFVLLENNEWDIRDRHSVEIVVDDEDEAILEISDEEEEEEEIEEDVVEEDIDSIDEDDSLDDDNDLDELSIIDEDDEEEE